MIDIIIWQNSGAVDLSLVNRSSNACLPASLPAAESSEALAILATYDNRPWEQPYDHPNLHGKHYGIFFDQKTW